jgi:hypothetical protein
MAVLLENQARQLIMKRPELVAKMLKNGVA